MPGEGPWSSLVPFTIMERASVNAVGAVAALVGWLLRLILLALPAIATLVGLALITRGLWLFHPGIAMVVLGVLLLLVPARFRLEARR